MGGADWAKTKSKARKAVREIAGELVRLYAARAATTGHAFSPDTPWQTELEEAFPYTETPDQLSTIDEVKADMEKAQPMDRLVCGDVGYGIDPKVVGDLADQIAEIVRAGVQMAVVVGGGNIFRGLAGSAEGMDRAQADYIGMLATVMNALALQDAFERHGIFSRVQSAINMQEVSEPYIRRRAIRHMEKGRVVILAAGTGNPYFTTDTTAALRACELDVDVLMKATKVDGVYDSDPKKNPDAKRYDRVSYMEVLSKGLNVMDSTATSLCMDNDVPMIVFDLTVKGNISRALKGEDVGTTVESQ